MIAEIISGNVAWIHIYRKCYKKSRWRKALNRYINQVTKEYPGYDGLILYKVS